MNITYKSSENINIESLEKLCFSGYLCKDYFFVFLLLNRHKAYLYAYVNGDLYH